jgi:hypothetical protein
MQRRRPAMSDLEVSSLSLTAEYMGIDRENDLFPKLPPFLGNKIDRSVYNRRKRRLRPYQNAIRLKLTESFNGSIYFSNIQLRSRKVMSRIFLNNQI